jgi:hypothetical protein
MSPFLSIYQPRRTTSRFRAKYFWGSHKGRKGAQRKNTEKGKSLPPL